MSEVKVNKISPRTNCGTVTVGDAGDSVTVTAGVPVTVNGDLKSNALKAIDGGSIISQCGTNITLGASGDTITLAAGASQTGFGRTGTVNWDTTAKTASFTAVSGNGYFVNTTSAAITLTLPSSPSAGDIVAFKDYAFTFSTNNLSLDGNGSPIGGVDGTDPVVYSTDGTSKTFIYVDGTKGWLATNESTDTSQESSFVGITATGGTVTCCGDYKIHTFTGPGTFCVSALANDPSGNAVDYLVVAGGGGAGYYFGSAGGAGGFRESHCASVSGPYTASPLATPSSIPVSVTGYPISVGGGGASQPSNPSGGPGTQGSSSSAFGITSAGGGYGTGSSGGANAGGSGGSGGGGSGGLPGGSACGGAGNTPPVSPPQGNAGGSASGQNAGAGGGATGVGGSGCGTRIGGAGAGTNINPATGESGPGCLQYYAGGGAGQPNSVGEGGIGGGGDANAGGTANTGGGAGGDAAAFSGGSGIVIIRYRR